MGNSATKDAGAAVSLAATAGAAMLSAAWTSISSAAAAAAPTIISAATAAAPVAIPVGIGIIGVGVGAGAIVLTVRKVMEAIEKNRQRGMRLPAHAPKADPPVFLQEQLSPGRLHFAVTGMSGCGKSTLINTIRQVRPRETFAAPVGAAGEITKQPTPYPHPVIPCVYLWDLPGAGTPDHPAKTYVNDMALKYMHGVIIMIGNRVFEIDQMLLDMANELHSHKVPLYIIRGKFDEDARNEERDHGSNVASTLQLIRARLARSLPTEMHLHSRLFVLSSVLGEEPAGEWDRFRELLAQDLERIATEANDSVGSPPAPAS